MGNGLREGLLGTGLLTALTARVILLLLGGSLARVGLSLVVLLDFLLFRVGQLVLFSFVDRHCDKMRYVGWL